MIKTIIKIALLALITFHSVARGQDLLFLKNLSTAATNSMKSMPPPIRIRHIQFNKDGINQGGFSLKGTNPDQEIEFTVRKDEIVTQALLKLHFTPSPSLIPIVSQLKVYLNSELMGVISITAAQLGHSSQIEIPLDPRYITDFNKIRFSFIGHYKDICENPASSTLWLDVSQSSTLEITLQTLELSNRLDNFPEPFFDPQDRRPLNLPIVFSAAPTTQQLKAAAIVASWFGTKAEWRGQSFQAIYNQLPTGNAIVFATNSQRPDFLKAYKTVSAPTIEMMSHPNNPYVKFLLILGKDDSDLITAAKGLAQGHILFRGESVVIDQVERLIPRQPYDAPNWVRTHRPTSFVELQKFKEQLQTAGVTPYPITLNFNLPPDLFIYGSQGVEINLKYRYSPPTPLANSHLNISLNNYFLKSYDLTTSESNDSDSSSLTNLPHLNSYDKKIIIPSLQLGPNNQLSFYFEYATSTGGGTIDGHCQTVTLTSNSAAIDGSSTIDFSNYYHYLAMPNLKVFAKAGFPFSRMADLSETGILIDSSPAPEAVNTLLNVAGHIGAQTGYPILSATITDQLKNIQNKNVDILIIGSLPKELVDKATISLGLKQSISWVKEPVKQIAFNLLPNEEMNTLASTQTWVTGTDRIAAIIGFQSPFFKQRSIIALLADNDHDYHLLNDALTNPLKQDQIKGSVTILRDSGIKSLEVGPIYHIGHLPWWLRVWLILQTHPIGLALASLLTAALISLLAWHALVIISRYRLKKKN